MKHKQESTIPSSMALMQEIVRFGGMQIQYCLRVREGIPNNHFEICVTKDGESIAATAGDDLEYALECYHKVVSGIVTPCTLDDVMRDFEYSRLKLKKHLYKRSIL